MAAFHGSDVMSMIDTSVVGEDQLSSAPPREEEGERESPETMVAAPDASSVLFTRDGTGAPVFEMAEQATPSMA